MNRLLNKKITLFDIGVFLAFLLVIKPQYFAEADIAASVEALYYYGKIAVLAVAFTWFVLRCLVGHKLSTTFIFACVLYIWYAISAAVNGLDWLESLTDHLSIVIMLLLFECAEERLPEMLSVLRVVLELMALINLATILMFPSGMYSVQIENSIEYRTECWFFGYRNNHLWMILPTVMLSGICDCLKKGRYSFRFFLVLVVAIATCFLIGSATASIAILLTAMVCVIFSYLTLKETYKHINVYIPLLALLLVSVFLVVLGNVSALAPLAELFGRASDFSGRTDIWNAAIKMVTEAPIVGYGTSYFYVTSTLLTSHPHNQILYILLMGGVVALLIWTVLFVLMNHALTAYENPFAKMLFVAVISGYACAAVAESFTYFSMLIPIVLLAVLLVPYFAMGQNVSSESKDVSGRKVMREIL